MKLIISSVTSPRGIVKVPSTSNSAKIRGLVRPGKSVVDADISYYLLFLMNLVMLLETNLGTNVFINTNGLLSSFLSSNFDVMSMERKNRFGGRFTIGRENWHNSSHFRKRYSSSGSYFWFSLPVASLSPTGTSMTVLTFNMLPVVL